MHREAKWDEWGKTEVKQECGVETNHRTMRQRLSEREAEVYSEEYLWLLEGRW